ncbi:MAG: hypothetical protein Q8R55_07890 [Candidatus Taylorbacteria bacterium]|nr:hypothetical protein [Candidatus Taylorbacteria bacterium]
MIYLRNSILATVIYYDVFDYPLTLLEIYKYLVNPARLHRLEGGVGDISLSDIAEELNRLVNSKLLGEKNGFYFINGKDGLFSLRMEKHKIADRKWKKFLKQVKFLSLAPYLRGVFASGSMAINNTDEKSDFDVLVIAETGRLYTCRLFLWLISSLMGTRRKKHEKIAPDKLCFNHYLTAVSLYIPHESIFNAQTYVNLKPVMIRAELIDRFYTANLWLNNYVYNFRPQKEFSRRSVKPSLFLIVFARLGESILDSFLGDWLEFFFKKYQQKRINDDPKTHQSGGRVVFGDNELEFHPHSFERVVIERYNKGLEKLGVVSYVKEADSGLA